uniref:Beta-galactosidase-1-like protein 2 isoform X1 n=1 Tax=Diabrotica virgifera virgifera TaxID=50390 RepID=A0A6P7FG98_DIAVI
MALAANSLPTLYEYYTGNGITQGLSDNQPYFTLNEKNITLYSGALHYFRVPRKYWRDRLRKMRAAGLNTVETYVPWNLHEPQPGVYDFGQGGTDMEDFLHIDEFLRTAKEEDILVLVRPGPYICAEWEFGGFPSWLLRNVTTVRSSKDKNYMTYIQRWFNVLLPILALFQFQRGGSIVGFQVENEFASLSIDDPVYLNTLKKLFIDNGITELLYTADAPDYTHGIIPGVLQTANVGSMSQIINGIKTMHKRQPNKPNMVMETYTGWFDHWGETHHTTSAEGYLPYLKAILDFPSSINMYMFVGGTSFGFMNGANDNTRGMDNSGLQIDTTSYDYDSPISEYGNVANKFSLISNEIIARNPVKTKLPPLPNITAPVKYPSIMAEGQLLLSDIIDESNEIIKSENVMSMERLPINNNSGQSYGYIVYRQYNLYLAANSVLTISGYVRDTVLVLLNGELVSPAPVNEKSIEGFGFWKLYNSTLSLGNKELQNATLDLVVENFGRCGYGALDQFQQYKGLTDDVFVNGNKLTDWTIIPLEFKTSWNKNLGNWKAVGNTTNTPALYKFSLNIPEEPQDTFVSLRTWVKGITIVNGFVLGRHFFIGPQQTLYLPAPFLHKGKNDIIVFEHYYSPTYLDFVDHPIFEKVGHVNTVNRGTELKTLVSFFRNLYVMVSA